jgi:hypothetical protein
LHLFRLCPLLWVFHLILAFQHSLLLESLVRESVAW